MTIRIPSLAGQRVGRRHLLASACLAALLAPWQMAQAQSEACAGAKQYVLQQMAEIAKLPEALQAEQEHQVYKYVLSLNCQTEGGSPAPFYNAVRQCGAAVAYKGSTVWEEMSCCGYDPQRRTFACPVKINQRTGYGAAPLPGSREFVMHCVFDANQNAWREVGTDSVHLADNPAQPTWQFAVVANAHRNLHLVQPMDGATRRARSILSWNLRPTGCDYQPIWGNVIDYRIRLDQ